MWMIYVKSLILKTFQLKLVTNLKNIKKNLVE
jgi:hypothetical protein